MREDLRERIIKKISLCTPMCDGFDQIMDIITELDDEIEELKKMYSQACDAAGSYEQQARAAESEIRSILNSIER
jgi:hypothetical protein